MTTATIVTIPAVPAAEDRPDVLEAIRAGLLTAACSLDSPFWDDAYKALGPDETEPEAVRAFEPVYEAAIEEIVPAVARLLTEAMNRRLPWTWEPEH